MRLRMLGFAFLALLMGAVVILIAGIPLSSTGTSVTPSPASSAVDWPKETGPAHSTTETASSYKTYSATQVKALMDQQVPLIIVNVDPPEYFEAEHIKGAISLPINELEERFGELQSDGLVILYCA